MTRRLEGWRLSCALLEWLALTVWIGAFAAILTMVIPAVFNTLDMETGGRMLRRVFDGYHAVTAGLAVVLAGTALVRYGKHRQAPARHPPPGRVEGWLLVALAAATFWMAAVGGPAAADLQDAAFAAESREARQTALEDFFRLHTVLRALHLVNAGLVVGLLASAFRRRLSHDDAAGECAAP